MIDDVIYFVGSSYALLLHFRFLYAYVVACFRSDIPITIVLKIVSMTWDVVRGGWLGPWWSNDAIDGWEEPCTKIVLFHDGCIYLLWWMDVSCMLLVSFILLYFVSWIRWRWCISIFTYEYSFSLSYPVTCTMDVVHTEFHLPRGIRNKCILWTLDFLIILSCGCGRF